MAEAGLTGWKRLLETPEPPALGPAPRAGTLTETQLDAVLNPVPAGHSQLIRALLLLWHDHLAASHNLSQEIENADGSFIHALMHRREPDAWNSKYWWRRVGNHSVFPELARRVDALLRSRGAGDLANRLLPGGRWDANAFVDACDAAMTLPEDDARVKLLREIQRVETEVLLEHLVSTAK